MKLGIDLDGCLVDFNKGYIDLLIKAKGKDLFPPDRTDENFPPVWFYEREFGYGDVEEGVWKDIRKSEDFWFNLPPMPDAEEAIDLLNFASTMDNDVYFITHRSGYEVKAQSEDWLRERGMPNPTVLLAGNKEPIIEALELNFYIDDKFDLMKQLDRAYLPHIKHLYIKDAPYNRQNYKFIQTKRVASVLEALREVS